MIWLSAGILALATVAVGQRPRSRQPAVPEKESYTRPKPTKPIKPEIPSADRYRTDKVFLEYADSLYRRPFDVEEHQIVKGGVKFRQGNMWMFCDSAYYYPELNSLDAFGHVRMEQGDTLFVYADKLYYNGDEKRARLRCGPSESKVRMVNRHTSLITDSLDYDLGLELGWYDTGGRIEDEYNSLTSVVGQYSPSTKDAEFYEDVVLTNSRDGSTMTTDTLYYNTSTHIASIVSPTRISSATDTIITSGGSYNTASDNARLTSRSIIMHRDSSNNVTTLEGDSIIYDRTTRISRAYMFAGPGKHALPMVITDTARCTILVGGTGYYNDSTREAWAARYPLLMEFSRPDTLFLRADTIRTAVVRRMVFPPITALDSLSRLAVQMLGDSTAATAGGDPKALIELIHGAVSSEPPSEAPGVAASVAPPGLPHGSVPPQPRREPLPVLRRDSSEMVEKDFHMAKAYRRARFFNNDLQGVADSMTFVEYDSTLYLDRRPIVWNGQRQVYGGAIQVHFNDSVPDRAYLPEGGMLAEYIDEDFYDQLSGKVMTAYFRGRDLDRLDVSGNVQTIFLPQENDSTYSRMVSAESSFLALEMEGRDIKRLKMWPEVNGTVSPLFVVKDAEKYLPGFRWYEAIRPRREWYGDRWRWADDLGEVPEELELYFSSEEDM